MATKTVKEVAVQFGSDGRTVRKFLRSVTPKDEQPGKGNRWSIEARSMKTLRKQFDAWVEAKLEKAASEDADETEIEEIEVEDETTD